MTRYSMPVTSRSPSGHLFQQRRDGYLDLDLVAMAINLGLTPSLGRENSTAIVAGFFHQWASAVGHAEADLSRDFFMAVGGVGWNAAKKCPELLLVTHGTLDQITEDFRTYKGLGRFFHRQHQRHHPTAPCPRSCGRHRSQPSVLFSTR